MKEGSPARTVIRYLLFQLPGLAALGVGLLLLRELFDLPAWAIWVPVTVWVVKDAALFPFVWRSYVTSPSEDAGSMIGKCAIVQERLAPSGRVRFGGEIWTAQLSSPDPPVDPGGTVRVVDMQGLTLIVEPETPSSPPSP